MTMLSINTNVGALNAAQSSYSVNKSMETSMARIASGKRINTGADDAAGLFISQRMNTEIQGLNQGQKCCRWASSLNTAEGTLDEVHTILLRMRELAVQGSNGTYVAQDIRGVRAEIADLQLEINRIAEDTTWNGKGLLQGSLSSGITFQVGPDNTHSLTVSLRGVSIAHLSMATVTAGAAGTILTTAASMMVFISIVDRAISIISTDRGTYAAASNILDHEIANMQNVATNLSTAKGRIEDADFAAETSNLARVQVLQQAGMAMLAQANAAKQNILSLFQ